MFAPRYVKHSKLLLRHAQKFLRYKRDVLDQATAKEIESAMGGLEAALRQRDRKQAETHAEELDAKLHKLVPVNWESHWRENVEVILVAIVVAVGIRSYFLQPFKIPTGSMQPTLNGIIGYSYCYNQEQEIPAETKDHYEKRGGAWYLKGYPVNAPKPNFLQRAAEFVLRGRNYINVVSRENDRLLQVEQKKFLFFFTFSRLRFQHQRFWVYVPQPTLQQYFHVFPERVYNRGEIVARGAIDTGDQVFVDKLTYNFVKPHRGDIFVFRTDHIQGIAPDAESGQQPFYIKRLAGLPGDTLRIAPPKLYVDEKVARGHGFERVMAAKDGYRGYSLGRDYLAQPDRSFTVPAHSYFAMGDNSYNSSDSRYWGPVPEENLVGRGLLVYWPFIPHFWLIR